MRTDKFLWQKHVYDASNKKSNDLGASIDRGAGVSDVTGRDINAAAVPIE